MSKVKCLLSAFNMQNYCQQLTWLNSQVLCAFSVQKISYEFRGEHLFIDFIHPAISLWAADTMYTHLTKLIPKLQKVMRKVMSDEKSERSNPQTWFRCVIL